MMDLLLSEQYGHVHSDDFFRVLPPMRFETQQGAVTASESSNTATARAEHISDMHIDLVRAQRAGSIPECPLVQTSLWLVISSGVLERVSNSSLSWPKALVSSALEPSRDARS